MSGLLEGGGLRTTHGAPVFVCRMVVGGGSEQHTGPQSLFVEKGRNKEEGAPVIVCSLLLLLLLLLVLVVLVLVVLVLVLVCAAISKSGGACGNVTFLLPGVAGWGKKKKVC